MNHYTLIGVGEEIFGALTVEFEDRVKAKREEKAKTRINLRIIVYCPKSRSLMNL